ncbi:MAG: hypothetical protein AMXMBFR22_24020 [Phycisphaerae bacterium]
MQLDILSDKPTTEVGSYFISNYPPFSAWSAGQTGAVERVLGEASAAPTRVTSARPAPGNGSTGAPTSAAPASGAPASASPVSDLSPSDPPPLGLYLHIPFCRKRCHFCYFRVYTDKNSSDVDAYIDALSHEVALYARRERFRDRPFDFVYFGGGTPSFLSNEQLRLLVGRINEHWHWDHAREVTFECEPGTLKESKLEVIRDIGVTRLSLGVEHFDDETLALNGRAHKSPEIFRAYDWARRVGFPQINLDLIAGMVGDTEDRWHAAVERALDMAPDSLTVYQMEVPHNTTLARDAKAHGEAPPVAGWSTKRAWVDAAFRRFEQAGYVVSSAYTVVKPGPRAAFRYRDALWRGADMVGTGVASFSHVAGVHFQNADRWEDYLDALASDRLPIARAFVTTDRQRFIRELVLQLKLGRIDLAYFRGKFAAEAVTERRPVLDALVEEGFARFSGSDAFELTRAGLLRVDGLLPRFFEPQFQGVRYT